MFWCDNCPICYKSRSGLKSEFSSSAQVRSCGSIKFSFLNAFWCWFGAVCSPLLTISLLFVHSWATRRSQFLRCNDMNTFWWMGYLKGQINSFEHFATHLCFVSFLRSALAHTDDTTLHNWFPSPSLTTKIYHIWNVSRMQNRDGILRSDCDFDFLLPWKTRTWLLNPHLRHYMSTRGCCTEIVVIDFTNICRSFSCNVATANLTTFVTLPDEVNLAFWLNIFWFVSMCKSRYIHHETFCDNDFVIPCRCMSGQFCHKPAFASHNNQEGARRPTELVPAKCFTILHGSSFTCPSP